MLQPDVSADRRYAACILCGIAAVFLACSVAASAQTFPDRTVRIVVPFPPGGPLDASGAKVD